MKEEGTQVPTYFCDICVGLLQACANAAALQLGTELHAQIKQQRLPADVFVASSLLNMYVKCGSLQEARRVFDGLGSKNVVTWCAMVAGYSRQGMGQEALDLYRAMQEEGVPVPDSVTFLSLLQACGSLGTPALAKGQQMHAQIRERRLQADVFVANSLVSMYAKCGSLEEAQRVFGGLRKRDVVTWNAMIAGYSQQGKGQEALCLHSTMQEEDMATPDSMTFVSLLQACASLGTLALQDGQQLHAQIGEQGLERDVFVANSLVNMSAKCSSLEDVKAIIDGLAQRDVVTWNAMIAGYSQQSLGQEAFDLYKAMQEEGMAAPDSVTFVCLLQA